MASLERARRRATSLDVDALADAIQRVGFSCTHCGACCRGDPDDPHTATAFPDDVRAIASATGEAWRDVARPMPFGLDDDGSGETFEWALQTSPCGDCRFYDGEPGTPGCTVYDDRPGICRTYPFSVDIGATVEPNGEVVDRDGPLRIHECEGIGREIDREDAEALASSLKERALADVREMLAVRDGYRERAVEAGTEETVIYDSEGPKRPDGTPLDVG